MGALQEPARYPILFLYMPPKEKRLTHNTFPRDQRPAKTQRGECATVRIYPSDDFKVAVVVSKKIAKRAVVRNKLRRRIYNTACAHKSARGVFVIYPTKEALTLPFKGLERCVLGLMG